MNYLPQGILLFRFQKLVWGKKGYYQGRIEHTFFKVWKELFIHVFEKNISPSYQLQHLLAISVNSFTNKWTHKLFKTEGASRHKHLALTLISKELDLFLDHPLTQCSLVTLHLS